MQLRLDQFREEFSSISQKVQGYSDRLSSTESKDVRELIEDAFRTHANFRNYIIFNTNQSNSIAHGNDAAVASVMRESVLLLSKLKELHILANKGNDAWLSRKTYFLCIQIHSLINKIARHKELYDPSLGFSGLAARRLLQKTYSVLSSIVLSLERNAYRILKLVWLHGKVREFTRSCRKLRKALQMGSRVPRSWNANLHRANKVMKEVNIWRDQNILADVYEKALELMMNRPRKDWKSGEHKALADGLGVSNGKGSKYLNEMIHRGDLTR